MGILAKYLSREFFKLLIACLLIFVFIYLSIDFTGRVDDFIGAHVPTSRMLLYFLYECPYIIVQMLPPATLIAVIILFSSMKKNNEIVALKACGMNVLKLSQPLLVFSLFLGAGLFLVSEVLVPFASSRSMEIWRVDVRKQDPSRFFGRNQIWYKGSDCIYWIKHFDGARMIMSDPSFYFFDPSFNLTKKIDGRTAVWKQGQWEVRDGMVLEAQGHGNYTMKKFEKMDLNLPESPETFVRVEKKPEEMNYWQLKQFAEKTKEEGYDATKYFVDLNIKVSFPFVIPIMVLIGIPVALFRRKGGAPVAVSMGMVLCFLYLLILGLSRSVGFAAIFPPILSAWLANGIFFFLGTYLMLNVDR